MQRRRMVNIRTTATRTEQTYKHNSYLSRYRVDVDSDMFIYGFANQVNVKKSTKQTTNDIGLELGKLLCCVVRDDCAKCHVCLIMVAQKEKEKKERLMAILFSRFSRIDAMVGNRLHSTITP